MTLSKRLKRYRGWVAVAAILVVAAVAIVLTRGSADPGGASTYTTEKVTTGTLSVTVDGTGNLAVRDEVEVYPDVEGTVSKVLVAEGEQVEQGDVLFELSATSVNKEVASAKAAKQQASTSVSKAKLELYRANASLSKLEEQADEPTSSVSSSDISIAKKEVSIAKAGVTSAQTSLENANDDYEDARDALDDLEVTAPCDGIVWSVSAEKGDSVTKRGSSSSGTGDGTTAAASTASSGASSAPMTLARDGVMGVELTVNEVDVTTLQEGQDAEIEFDAVTDLKMTGTVDEVATQGTVDSGVVSYSVWLTLNGTDERLKTGMSAAATIVTQVERNALLVPNSAIKTTTDGTTYVQVLDAGGASPQDVTVTVGASNATQTVIKSGVSEGTSVVTKTTTSSASDDSASDTQSGGGGGIMMMGGGPSGGPPSGGPGGP